MAARLASIAATASAASSLNLVKSKSILASAQGRSEFIVAVFADIRGFSQFSRTCEAPNIAMYVKRLYLELLEKHFTSATFSKPTGDGLLLIFPYDEHTLNSVCQQVVDACIKCHAEFSEICAGDPMLNFPLPEAIGFGIARGTACCLYSGKQIIDYSGHLLNLSARLNDLARPSGVVIDGNFSAGLIAPEQLKLFSMAKVFLRGVAEDSAVEVLSQNSFVSIPASAFIPIQDDVWVEKTKSFTKAEFKDLLDADSDWAQSLGAPAVPGKVKVEIKFPKPGSPSFFVLQEIFEFSYTAKPQPKIVVRKSALNKYVPMDELSESTTIRLVFSFVKANK